MDNYICKRGNKEDLLKRWNYLVDIHPRNNSWVVFRENNIRNFDNNYIIPYYGILKDKIICEITAYIRPEAFIGDISNPEGLYSDTMAYLATFRTDKEFEGRGFKKNVIYWIKLRSWTRGCKKYWNIFSFRVQGLYKNNNRTCPT